MDQNTLEQDEIINNYKQKLLDQQSTSNEKEVKFEERLRDFSTQI